MPIRKKTKAVGAAEAVMPSIPEDFIAQCVTGPMTGEAVETATMAFRKALIERVLGAELSHHLGYAPGADKPEAVSNHRNGSSDKTVLTGAGPLRIEVVEPFARARIALEPGLQPLSLELDWRATLPPKEEDHHFTRLRGRVASDYRRYTQLGRASGRIELGGRAFEVRDWFAPRDHSWGVRQQVAGPEPVTGPPGFGLEHVGFVFYWLPFECEGVSGHVQLQTLGDGTVRYRDGIVHRADGSTDAIEHIELDAEFFPGTRAFSRIRARWTGASGHVYEVVTEPLLRGFSMDGTGYDWGWNDGQGLGVYRGESYSECDVYDLSDPEEVVRPNGERRRPMHRETPSRVWVDGAAGTGHQVFIATGPVPILGLT